ncbi:MAG: TolC family protein [bacterium]
MNTKSIALILSLSLIWCIPGVHYAKEYSWQELLEEAKLNNPELRQARESLQKSGLLYKKSYSGFLPSISASASASQSDSNQGDLSKSYSYGLRGSLSLFSGFSDFYNVKSGKINLKKSDLELMRALSDIVYNVKLRYINLLWAQENAALSEGILERRKNNYEMILLKYEAGREDKGSLLRVEADKLQAEHDVNNGQRELKTAAYELCEILGKDIFEIIRASGTLQGGADFKNIAQIQNIIIENLIEHTPEFEIAQYDLILAEYNTKQARSNFYPSLSLSSSLSNSGDQWEDPSHSWSTGLSVSYPIFSGANDYYNLKVQNRNTVTAQENFRKTKHNLLQQLQAGLNNYIDAIENIKIREKYLEASEEQSHVTTAKYINGLTTYYDWYSVENNFISSQKSYISAIRDAIISEAKWLNLLGE